MVRGCTSDAGKTTLVAARCRMLHRRACALRCSDALPREKEAKTGTRLKVVVPVYPRIANHNDFDPLRFHPEVDFTFLGPQTRNRPAT